MSTDCWRHAVIYAPQVGDDTASLSRSRATNRRLHRWCHSTSSSSRSVCLLLAGCCIMINSWHYWAVLNHSRLIPSLVLDYRPWYTARPAVYARRLHALNCCEHNITCGSHMRTMPESIVSCAHRRLRFESSFRSVKCRTTVFRNTWRLRYVQPLRHIPTYDRLTDDAKGRLSP